MRYSRRLLTMVGLAALASGGMASAAAHRGPLPPSGAVTGWHRASEVRLFTPRNLWEYIDGAADVFLAYGFVGLQAAQYARDGAAERPITIDVYDMGSPLNAFGVFASERSEGVKPIALGAQGYSANGLIAFWKGTYYVKTATVDERDVISAKSLAALTAGAITGTTQLPREFRLLPVHNRVVGSERYARRDALGHKVLSNVISADFRAGRAVATMYLSDLPSTDRAQRAWQQLRDFERRTGRGLSDLRIGGEAGAAVRDASYGEMLLVRYERFILIGAGEKANRVELTALVRRALERLKRGGASVRKKHAN